MKIRWFLYVSIVLLLTCVPVGQAQQEEPLSHGIVGSETGTAKPSYSGVIQHVPVQKLLLDLAKAPRDRTFLETALSGTDVSIADLETLGLIRAEGAHYVLAFTLFTREDVRRIHDASEEQSRSLAEAFLARRGEIETVLRKYDAPGVDPKAVAYIVLGCFSLDWDGLDLTAEKHYRTVAQPRPNGDTYVPWAEENSDVSHERVFWGSHNHPFGEVQFTSFGDHQALPRHAFPDLLWRSPWLFRTSNLPDALKPALGRILQVSLERMAEPTGRILLSLRHAERTREQLVEVSGLPPKEADGLIGLLVQLDYITEKDGRFRATIPVLTADDAPLVLELRRIGWQVMEAWLAAHYEPMKASLGEITPMRYGVSYADGFTQTWHWIFGLTNQRLVEAGLFADPYAESRKYKGFIPAVYFAKITAGRPAGK